MLRNLSLIKNNFPTNLKTYAMYSMKSILLNQTMRSFASVFSVFVLFLVTMTSVNAQLSVSVAKTDPACAGFTNGSAVATATGGVAPYTYAWSNGATGNALSGLGGGVFGVTVTASNGATATGSTTLTMPAALAATSSFASICSGGAVTVTATGGTAPYTYNWGGGRVGATQNGLAAGGYNVVVTDSRGCTVNRFVNVPAPFTAGLRVGELVCFGDCDAAIDALPQGGTGPYTYRWNTGATTAAIIGIPSGTYSVTITDANGCTGSSTGTVVNPPATTLTTTRVSPGCGAGGSTNGSATASATGGRPPFTYRWSNGQTTATATGLSVGTYFVTATDAKGCNTTASVVLTSSAGFTLNATGSNASCGSSNGGAAVSVTGGTAPFRYTWSTGATTQTLSNLGAGSYTVTVSDASGCSAVATATVNAVGNLNISLTSTNAACGIANGSVTATPTSGTAPFRYAWSNGATTQTIGTLGAGTYTVTVTDASGCTATGSRTVTQTTSFDVNLDARNISCNGGTNGQVSAMVMGGSAPYTYRWSNGSTIAVLANLGAGTYTVTVTDVSGCTAVKSATVSQPSAVATTVTGSMSTCGASNGSLTATTTGGTGAYTYRWSTGATTATISGLAAGTYTVTATDANGCTASRSMAITTSAQITVTTSTTAARCNGVASGSATATASGGTAPYTYRWSNGGTTATISNVAATTYSVTATDAAGCTSIQIATVSQPTGISLFVDVTDATCTNGTGRITNTVSGGTAPYTYLWSTGATTLSLTNLSGGSYTLTVTDASGCTRVSTTTVNFVAPPTVNLTPTNIACNGGSTGAVAAVVTGGTAPFSYAWSNSATSATLTGLAAGAYTVTVTDARGCTATRSVTLTQAAIIVITPTVVSATCLPAGSIAVVATGGSGTYTYLWSNGMTTATISNLAGGNYTVTVTDGNGCRNSLTVNVPSVISTNFTSTIAVTKALVFQGGRDGEATVTPVNGRAPYTYRWSNGGTLATATGLTAGTYTVTITDANGCTTTNSITITEPTCTQLTNAGTITGNQTFCNPSELTGINEATPGSGGTGAIQYLWMWSDFTANFDAGSWNTIAGATGKDLPANLLPNMIRATNFIRCIRRAGCEQYIEGNVVTKTPTVAFSFQVERFPCLSRPNVFTAADNGAGATYQWTFNGANISSANTRVANVTFTALGARSVTLTISKAGCTITRNVPVDVVNCLADYGNIFAFSASTTGTNGVRLNWATTDEKKASKYMIEKSADNVNFSLIGTVASQNLPNNLYNFSDPEPKQGRSFYRIHQMSMQDVDVNMSKTERVVVAEQGQALVSYPNPAGANLFVEVVDMDNTEGVIEIYSETGALVKTQRFTANQVRYEVDTNNLGTGNYFVKVRRADGSVSTTKFSKF
jgi:SprB repeat/Secretion system C-terminal sorting domain